MGRSPVLAQTEQSLVRPRDEEDEGEDERAAKRSKVEEEPGPEPQLKIPTSETVLPDAPVGDDVVEPQAVDVAETVVEPIVDAVAEPVVESAVESVEDSAAEPLVESDAKDVKVEATQVEAQPPDAPDVPVESVSAVVAETPLDEKPAETQASTEAQSQVESAGCSGCSFRGTEIQHGANDHGAEKLTHREDEESQEDKELFRFPQASRSRCS